MWDHINSHQSCPSTFAIIIPRPLRPPRWVHSFINHTYRWRAHCSSPSTTEYSPSPFPPPVHYSALPPERRSRSWTRDDDAAEWATSSSSSGQGRTRDGSIPAQSVRPCAGFRWIGICSPVFLSVGRRGGGKGDIFMQIYTPHHGPSSAYIFFCFLKNDDEFNRLAVRLLEIKEWRDNKYKPIEKNVNRVQFSLSISTIWRPICCAEKLRTDGQTVSI